MVLTSIKAKAAVVALTCASVVASVAALAPAAQADDSTTLTVLGTSDVSDSFLVQSVIKPGFERMYPKITLNYVGSGSGQAISAAEAGSGSALIVHAASLENQFVADGYSLGGAGRAIFYGDFVLAGPASDPAGVFDGTSPSHDIVGAFEKIAAAGVAGKATFVSRGGTPGTTVAEHSIWPLTDGIETCTVSAANGGGTTPSTTSGACPDTVKPPSWYAVTGAKQGANVQAADTCAPATFPNGGCYVFTDRGTFQYLEQQSLLKTLKIVVRDNAATARGGSTALTNSFHAYAINPAKFSGDPNVHLNPTAATDFLNYLTSPAAQTAVGQYLADTPEGAPFLPDASPLVTASAPVAQVTAGQRITITGTVRNVVPGTPTLAGIPVSLRVGPLATDVPPYIGTSTTTDSTGKYTISYAPVGRATYSVRTGSITKVERTDLSPTFSDVLTGTTTTPSAAVQVQGGASSASITGGTGLIRGTVRIAPIVSFQEAQLQLYAARYPATKPVPQFVAAVPIAKGSTSANYQFYLPKGTWYYQLHYVNNGVILPAQTGLGHVTVH